MDMESSRHSALREKRLAAAESAARRRMAELAVGAMRPKARRRFPLWPIFLLILLILAATELFAQRPNPKAPPLPNRRAALNNQQKNKRGDNKVPTPSALPSQRLASQAPKVQKGAQRSSCLLKSARKVGSSDIVEIVLEGTGDIEPSSINPEAFEGGKMELVAGFRYEERLDQFRTSGAGSHIRVFRQYEQAGMKRHYAGQVTRPLLDRSRKDIVSQFDGKKITQYCPYGPFKSDQFLLIDELPANTILLDLLLPNREVKLGDEWTISNDTLCALLGWDAVENNTVRLVLTAIIDDMAQVDMFLGDPGKDANNQQLPSTLQGASLGSSITADIQGKYQFDLKARRMTWFGLLISEKRSESLAEPGLDWKASLRIRIAPLEKPEKLDDAAAANFRRDPTPELLELYYNGQKGPWSFRHARAWRMIEDGEKSAALSFIYGGEGIAQCNILSNGKIELDSLPTMEGYKAELQKGLGERFGRFVTESEYTDDDNNKIYAVMIDGQYEEVPFRWIYYLITDPLGHQVTVMFEIMAERLDDFGDSGREIVDTFKMLFPDEPETLKEDGGLETLVNDKAGADGADADAIKVTVLGEDQPEEKQEEPPAEQSAEPQPETPAETPAETQAPPAEPQELPVEPQELPAEPQELPAENQQPQPETTDQRPPVPDGEN